VASPRESGETGIEWSKSDTCYADNDNLLKENINDISRSTGLQYIGPWIKLIY
jgi:hypothetical protein